MQHITEKNIEKQIQSILEQSLPVYEIVISDDGSKDHTVDIIKSFHSNKTAIKIFTNVARHGPNGNFENAIKHCTGDFIFLADQDDIWFLDKVEKFNTYINSNSNAKCITSNGIVIGTNDERRNLSFSLLDNISTYHYKFDRDKYLLPVLKHSLVRGMSLCCYRPFLESTLPFPEMYASHDHWILFCAVCIDSFYAINEPLVKYRLHESNLLGTTEKIPISSKKDSRYRRSLAKIQFYRKNWFYLVNNNYYIIETSMIQKLEELSMHRTEAYALLHHSLEEDRIQYEAYQTSGVMGAIKLLKLYCSNRQFRKNSSKIGLVYKLVYMIFSGTK